VRAALLSQLGAAPEPAVAPEPEAGERELVEVLAVALNPLDLAVGAQPERAAGGGEEGGHDSP